jgi:diguanylate cyclase (GGDEF)-like protein
VLRLEREARDAVLTLLRGEEAGVPVLADSVVRDSGDGDRIVVAMFDATLRSAREQRLLGAQRESERLARRVRVLQAASAAFTTADSELGLCASLAEVARDAFEAPETGVFLLDEDEQFVLVAGTNPLAGPLSKIENPGIAKRALDEGRIIVLRDVAAAEAFAFPLGAAFREARVESISVTPILDDGHAIGVLVCFFQRPREQEEVSIELKEALTKQAAQVLLRIRLQRRIREMAMHDNLTGLPHRQLFDEQLTEFLNEAVAEGGSLGVLFLDLVGFKAVNDVLGHAMGDALLAQVASRIRSTVRDIDAVGRYGGDEFVIACRHADDEVALAVAERVRAAIAGPFDGFPRQPAVSASIGVAVLGAGSPAAPSIDDIVRVADTAMYESKAAGRNRITLRRL